MKTIINFINRAFIAILLVFVSALLWLLLIGILSAVLGDNAMMAGALAMQAAIETAPAIFVGCFASHDTRKTRSAAVLKAVLIVGFAAIVWGKAIGPWIGQAILQGVSNGIQIGVAIDAAVQIILMVIAGVLAGLWIPSLKSNATGTPPTEVKRFEKIMFCCIGLAIISAVFNYDAAVSFAQKIGNGSPVSNLMGGPLIISNTITSILIILLFTVGISRWGSAAIRSVFLAFYLAGVLVQLLNSANFFALPLSLMLTALSGFLLQGYALYLVFTPAASAWLHPVVEAKELSNER